MEMNNKPMLNQAVLAVAGTSFLIVALIFSLYSIPAVFARINYGPIECSNARSAHYFEFTCCQTQTDTKSGLEIRYCTDCTNTAPISNCGPRYSVRANSQGSLSPGGNTTTAPSTGKLPPGSIIKAPPTITNTLTPTGNNTNSSIARAAGVYSPTGGCSTGSKVKCIPCDPGIKSPYCIPSSEWPPATSIPLTGNLTGSNSTGIVTKLPPGAFKSTGNLTNVLPGHQHHKGETTSSKASNSGNNNSTGH
jgi:hypothetical protein